MEKNQKSALMILLFLMLVGLVALPWGELLFHDWSTAADAEAGVEGISGTFVVLFIEGIRNFDILSAQGAGWGMTVVILGMWAILFVMIVASLIAYFIKGRENLFFRLAGLCVSGAFYLSFLTWFYTLFVRFDLIALGSSLVEALMSGEAGAPIVLESGFWILFILAFAGCAIRHYPYSKLSIFRIVCCLIFFFLFNLPWLNVTVTLFGSVTETAFSMLDVSMCGVTLLTSHLYGILKETWTIQAGVGLILTLLVPLLDLVCLSCVLHHSGKKQGRLFLWTTWTVMLFAIVFVVGVRYLNGYTGELISETASLFGFSLTLASAWAPVILIVLAALIIIFRTACIFRIRRGARVPSWITHLFGPTQLAPADVWDVEDFNEKSVEKTGEAQEVRQEEAEESADREVGELPEVEDLKIETKVHPIIRDKEQTGDTGA